MSIFQYASSNPTYRVAYDSIRPVEVEICAESTGATRPLTLDRNEEWVVQIRLQQNYWANKAQRPDAEKMALRCLAATLYEDVLRELPRLRLAIQSGDKAGAMDAAFRIEAATQPEPPQ